jgi:alkylated DNA repair dioxygenase AlkB
MDIRNYFKPLAQPESHSHPQHEPKIIRLDKDSYIEQGYLPDTLQYSFNDLWALHPEDYGVIRIHGKEVHTPRWQQSYCRPYYYSGMMHDALPLPPAFQPFLDWANTQGTFNQVLINWYADGRHYIGPHSDNEAQLVRDSTVLSISLGQERIFRVRRKSDNEIIKDINMPDKSYLMMCGKMQERYLHEVPKVTGAKGAKMERRINITFRMFLT